MDLIIQDMIMNTQIKLLDGKQYNKMELLSKMVDDEFYYGFMNTFAFSSSSIKLCRDLPFPLCHDMTVSIYDVNVNAM